VQDKPIRAGARLFSEGGQFLPAAKGSNPRRRYQIADEYTFLLWNFGIAGFQPTL